MNATGWEIKPLGWIALAVVAGLAIYVALTLAKNQPEEIKD